MVRWMTAFTGCLMVCGVAAAVDPATGFGALAGRDAKPATSWDIEKNKNIRWSVDVPAGASSPIADEKHVFLAASEGKKKQWLIAIDAKTGKEAWRTRIVTKATAEGLNTEVFDETVYAASTPAMNVSHIAVIFATGDLAVVDKQGNVVWVKHLGDPESVFGYASSPVIVDDKVVVQWDTGEVADLRAFDLKTGKEAWTTKRDVGNSWATPHVIVTKAGKQIITASADRVVGHDAKTGKVIWFVSGIESDENEAVTPSPISCGGFVFVVDPGNEQLLCIDTTGRGDVTKTHVKWKAEPKDGIATTPSPATDGKRVYVATWYGLMCFEPAKADLVWTHEPEDFTAGYSSPVYVAGKLFAADDAGAMLILQVSDATGKAIKPKQLGYIKGKATAGASPSFVGTSMYLRSKNKLYCIGD